MFVLLDMTFGFFPPAVIVTSQKTMGNASPWHQPPPVAITGASHPVSLSSVCPIGLSGHYLWSSSAAGSNWFPYTLSLEVSEVWGQNLLVMQREHCLSKSFPVAFVFGGSCSPATGAMQLGVNWQDVLIATYAFPGHWQNWEEHSLTPCALCPNPRAL